MGQLRSLTELKEGLLLGSTSSPQVILWPLCVGHSTSGLGVSEHTSDPSTGELGLGGPLGFSDWPAKPIIKPQVNERCHPMQHAGRLLRQTPDGPRLSHICTRAHTETNAQTHRYVYQSLGLAASLQARLGYSSSVVQLKTNERRTAAKGEGHSVWPH